MERGTLLYSFKDIKELQACF